MIGTDLSRRRSPPVMIWLMVVIVAAIHHRLRGAWAWWPGRRLEQIQALQTEVEALHSERQARQALIVAMQSTATVMEERLAPWKQTIRPSSWPHFRLQSESPAMPMNWAPCTHRSRTSRHDDAFQSSLDSLISPGWQALEPGLRMEQTCRSEVRLDGRDRSDKATT